MAAHCPLNRRAVKGLRAQLNSCCNAASLIQTLATSCALAVHSSPLHLPPSLPICVTHTPAEKKALPAQVTSSSVTALLRSICAIGAVAAPALSDVGHCTSAAASGSVASDDGMLPAPCDAFGGHGAGGTLRAVCLDNCAGVDDMLASRVMERWPYHYLGDTMAAEEGGRA